MTIRQRKTPKTLHVHTFRVQSVHVITEVHMCRYTNRDTQHVMRLYKIHPHQSSVGGRYGYMKASEFVLSNW